ncbi:uncharacterized protein N7511_005477 [Penicillium nucicola]|uniref:uncharacterized protein n=1 Tax=Penicillium nucicola TaxID=1850975 RepID=UPI002544E98F|nr:uncharacterized protein N7511_005477 [Penicillium nucicola]KAJ5762095.1 hypothetical protein N7511_005477 [Penicillium nucicola]
MTGRKQEAPPAPMATQMSSRAELLGKFNEECFRFKMGLRIQIARLDCFEGIEAATGDHLIQLAEQARLVSGLSLQIADAFSGHSVIQGKLIYHYSHLVPTQTRSLVEILQELGAILREDKSRGARRVSKHLKSYLEKALY